MNIDMLKRKKSLADKSKSKKSGNEIPSKAENIPINEIEKPQTKKKRYVMPSKFINEDRVKMCVDAILMLSEQHKNGKRIFEDETHIFAELHCMKIQNSKGKISFVLPHSTVASTGEVCLVTKDLKKGRKPDHEPTIEHFQELLQKIGVTYVKTILPMRQLRVEYDQYELKRRLLTQHDFIMVDTRVLNHVSHVMGKPFFKKHNMLVPVRMKDDEKLLKKSLDVSMRTSILRLNIGETSTMLIGHTGMPKNHLVENVLAVVKSLGEKFPGGEPNIRSIFLKLPLSLSVPLYVTLRSSDTVNAPKLTKSQPKNCNDVEGELSTIPGSKVVVTADGTVHLTREATSDNSDMDEENIDDSDDEQAEEIQSD